MSEPSMTPGDPIQARCTKCKENTDHVVVSMAETGPEKVQCGVCSRNHKYRPPIAPKKAPVKRVPIQLETERKKWKTFAAGADSTKALNYSMTSAYKTNALISHPVFGLGQVQRVIGTQKVEVLFETGNKVMRCK